MPVVTAGVRSAYHFQIRGYSVEEPAATRAFGIHLERVDQLGVAAVRGPRGLPRPHRSRTPLARRARRRRPRSGAWLCVHPADREWRAHAGRACRITDRVARQQHAELAARARHGVREPDDRVVLLLDRRAVCRFDALAGSSSLLPQRVPIVSVLADSTDIFQKSAGVPRPHALDRLADAALVDAQAAIHPVELAAALLRERRSSSSIQTRGNGWFSAAASRPCTAFACAAWRANGSATAPS